MDADLSAEDLYDKNKRKRGRPADKKDAVKLEILRLLESGEPLPSAELEEKVCATTGCHVNTLKAAKKDLGVGSFQSEGRWFSHLAGQGTKKVQGTIIPDSIEKP